MKKVVVPVLALATAMVAYAAPADAGPKEKKVKDHYIVVLSNNADPEAEAKKAEREHGAKTRHVYKNALKGYSSRMSATAAERISRNPNVQWVEQDKEVRATAQTLPAGINRADADLSSTQAGDGTGTVDVDVAVIDTGIDLDHPDLNVYTAGKKDCSLFGLGGLLTGADDDNGHGSHVAGTIGAKDNTVGVVGMAPGARLWPVKVLSSLGLGLSSDVVCGIDYVASKAGQIEVANMSLGGSGTDDGNCGRTEGDSMHTSICNAVAKGITFVVAAGNDHVDAKEFTPAAYDEVITVSALADFNGQPGGGAASTCRSDQDDTFADFSNYGADVDIIAPGVCILSTWMSGGYDTISGTSMASPHVAGGAALYKATHPTATPAQVKSALQAAGTTNWTWPFQDGDSIQERLLNVAGF